MENVPGKTSEIFEITLHKDFFEYSREVIQVDVPRVVRILFDEPALLATCIDTYITGDLCVNLTTGIKYYVHELLQDARGRFIYVINDIGEKRCYSADRFKLQN